jgi:hypothetical protein
LKLEVFLEGRTALGNELSNILLPRDLLLGSAAKNKNRFLVAVRNDGSGSGGEKKKDELSPVLILSPEF